MRTGTGEPIPSAAELGALLRSPLERPPSVTEARLAAVLIVLFDRGDECRFILTKRTDHLEHHPGQISLPGGGVEPEDASLAATALRETREEVGIPEESITVVGRLDDVFTHVSGFLVTPFIGVAHGRVMFAPDMLEIARVFDPSVAELLVADERLPAKPTIATLRYPLGGEDVWGATARILYTFTRQVRQVLGR